MNKCIEAADVLIEILERYASCIKNPTRLSGILKPQLEIELAEARKHWITERAVARFKEDTKCLQ